MRKSAHLDVLLSCNLMIDRLHRSCQIWELLLDKPPYTTVYMANTLRMSPYTVADRYDRNTVTCILAKYGRIRSPYQSTWVHVKDRPYIKCFVLFRREDMNRGRCIIGSCSNFTKDDTLAPHFILLLFS